MNGNPKKNKMIILGDFNSQIGRVDIEEGEKEYLGEYIGHELSNENGDFMKMFLRMHRMRICSMNFGKTLLTTWSNGTYESQIDHVVISVDALFEIDYIQASWTTVRTDHKAIRVVVKWGCSAKSNENRKLKRKLEPSYLKESKIQKLYHENLEKRCEINSNTLNTTEAYGLLLEKVNASAKEVLKATRIPLSPERKAALKAIKRNK